MIAAIFLQKPNRYSIIVYIITNKVACMEMTQPILIKNNLNKNKNFIHSYLPLSKKVRKKSVYSLFKIQVTMNIKIPHFRRHLNEQVDHGGRGSENDLRILSDDSASYSVALRPHLVDLTSYGATTIFNLLV